MFSFYISGNIQSVRSPATATPLPASAPALRSARPALAGCGMRGAGVFAAGDGVVGVGLRRLSAFTFLRRHLSFV
jgi:hypothetical protein